MDFDESAQSDIVYDGYNLGCYLTIVSGCFQVCQQYYLSISNVLFSFAADLEKCCQSLSGQATYKYAWEDDFYFTVTIGKNGHATVNGKLLDPNNELSFDFETEQSYLSEALSQLKQIRNALESKHETDWN